MMAIPMNFVPLWLRDNIQGELKSYVKDGESPSERVGASPFMPTLKQIHLASPTMPRRLLGICISYTTCNSRESFEPLDESSGCERSTLK